METDRINYKITFLSDWHAGSGLGSGADSDAVVIKDANNLPYLPGKTIKGLIKDSLIDIKEAQPKMMPKDFIDKYFGYEVKDENDKVLKTIPGSFFQMQRYLSQKEMSLWAQCLNFCIAI